jgi:hypothetical protein
MPAPFSGGCACRALRYECTVEPLVSWVCHCRDCQHATGSAYSVVFYVSEAALHVTGESRYYEVRSESGQTVRRIFCPQCGSPVLAKAGGWPEFTAVHASTLDDPSWFQPAVEIWTASAQPWDSLNPRLPHYERQPTAEEFQALWAPRS